MHIAGLRVMRGGCPSAKSLRAARDHYVSDYRQTPAGWKCLRSQMEMLSSTSWSEMCFRTRRLRTLSSQLHGVLRLRRLPLLPSSLHEASMTCSPQLPHVLINTTARSSTSVSEGINDKFISAPSNVAREPTISATPYGERPIPLSTQ